MKENTKEFSALLMDVNGVQVDSEPLLKEADIITFREFNYELLDHEHQKVYEREGRYSGGIIEDNNLNINQNEFKTKRWVNLQKLVEEKSIESVAGIRRLLAEIKYYHPEMQICSVSNNYQKEIVLFHEETGLTGKFDLVVTREMFKKRKPHPEPYLTASRMIGVKPECCIAIENSKNGIISAKEAGIKAIIGIRGRRELGYEEPEITLINTLEDVNYRLIDSLENKLNN
tara:strand:+ start:444 stop:1133 length:690 start_codon:yes stop_codon:yes gene_type:complete